MKKFLLLVLCISFHFSNAQILKEKYNFSNPSIVNNEKKILDKSFKPYRGYPLAKEGVNFKTASEPRFLMSKPGSGIQVLSVNEEKVPTAIQVAPGAVHLSVTDAIDLSENMKSLLKLKSEGNISFQIKDVEIDLQGTEHSRMNQLYKNVPVIDVEYILHTYKDGSLFLNGNALRVPELNVQASVPVENISEICKSYFADKIVTYDDQAVNEILKTGVLRKTLGVWKDNSDNLWKLVYFVKYKANLRTNFDCYIDAQSGKVLKILSNICNFSSHHNCTHDDEEAPLGAETAVAQDLYNSNQTINVWKEGNNYFMIDASRPMFNSSRSKFPDNTVGAIITFDAKNRNAESSSFTVDHIVSSTNTWPSKTSVSAHVNASKAYEYFRINHSRNSINGVGGNIISIINVTDGGGQMDNAFWNGEAMFYGNGKQAFTPLAKSLDVAGHEMSHGVIGSTANMVYENEPGALNESFADIFGAMIDRDDWRMGEDVVNISIFRSGALRDLSNPNNGGTGLSSNGWQPKHVNEQYKGSEDNGGVHINSGITNFAYYTFVTELAKTKGLEEAKKIGEKVYYHALTKFLTRSSNFKDLRVAIEKCATDLYGNSPEVLASVKIGFDKVGIAGTPGGGGSNPGSRVLAANPGKEFIICTDNDKSGLYLYDFQSSPIQLTAREINSKPSVTDNGAEIIYVGADKKLYYLMRNSNGTYTEKVLDTDPIYRNAVISKDGNLLAVVYDVAENQIHVYNFTTQKWADFKLYNPSYSNTTTGDVQYADVMDFDHSGQYVMYDAFNVIKNTSGQEYEYWDIGFLNVFSTSGNAFAAGKIDKLIAGLPENVTIGNPTFSKNSLDVVAFDYIEEDVFGASYTLVGANVETSDFAAILQDRPVLSYPNYSVKDNFIIFDGEDNNLDPSLNVIGLSSSKISSSGNEQTILRGGKWGVWFATGTRKLTIGVQNITDDKNIEVYPNPFEDFIQVQFDDIISGAAYVEIFNSVGQRVHVEKLKNIISGTSYSIQVSELNSGVYIMNVTTDSGISESVKLVRK
ncbi:MAG: T9SS type A sorting domain-containing protein [Saprospiraceae bacterium]|nr:T9SS type A sorting domain-containing protein [Saprospiraceae bacterium]